MKQLMIIEEDLFLTDNEIKRLTGIKRGYDKQCAQLAKMHIPYRVNALGQPLVTKSFIEGSKEIFSQSWHSNLKAA